MRTAVSRNDGPVPLNVHLDLRKSCSVRIVATAELSCLLYDPVTKVRRYMLGASLRAAFADPIRTAYGLLVCVKATSL